MSALPDRYFWRDLGVYCTINYVQYMVSNVVFARGHDLVNYSLPSLPDLGHEIFPSFHDHQATVPDIICAITGLVTAVVVLTHENRWLLIRKFLFIHGAICLMRTTTIPLTTLPSPVTTCRDPDHPSSRPFISDSVFTPPIATSGYCNDLIFSGHSSLAILCALFVHHSEQMPILKLMTWINATFSLVAAVATRDHYTVDVALAFYITLLTFLLHRAEVRALFKSDKTD